MKCPDCGYGWADDDVAAILEEAGSEPWKPEGRIESDDADGVWLANEVGDSLWLSGDDVARMLNHLVDATPTRKRA